MTYLTEYIVRSRKGEHSADEFPQEVREGSEVDLMAFATLSKAGGEKKFGGYRNHGAHLPNSRQFA